MLCGEGGVYSLTFCLSITNSVSSYSNVHVYNLQTVYKAFFHIQNSIPAVFPLTVLRDIVVFFYMQFFPSKPIPQSQIHSKAIFAENVEFDPNP